MPSKRLSFLGTTLLAIVGVSLALAQNNQLVSVSSDEDPADRNSYFSGIPADGRFVAFQSQAGNLVDNDRNGLYDVFIRDVRDGTTELVSVSLSGSSGAGLGLAPDISGDGRYVVFQSNAANLVDNDTNGQWDVFLRDTVEKKTTRVSLTDAGKQANDRSDEPSITPDGRYILFHSGARLVERDTNGLWDVYRLDRNTGELILVSTNADDELGNGVSHTAAASDDGRYVTFMSSSDNFVDDDSNGIADVFVKDLETGKVVRANLSSSGNEATGESIWPSISGNGRIVVFSSRAPRLVEGDTNNNWDLFSHDLQTRVTTRLNVRPDGGQANSYARSPANMSTDGRYVVYASLASDLVEGDTNGMQDIFIRDRAAEVTRRISYGYDGSQTDDDNFVPDITPDLRFATFTSEAENLVENDGNGLRDIFFAVLEAECEPCDTNCDGSIDLTDIESFIRVVIYGEACNPCAGDTNEDGSVDLTDVEGFIECLLG